MKRENGKQFTEINDNEKQEIINNFYEGLSKKDILNRFNISQRCYIKIFKEANINSKCKNRYTLNEDYFKEINTPQKAYILGFIAADGCITNTNYFAISSIDKDVLEFIKNEISYTGSIYTPQNQSHENWSKVYRINFSSKTFCNDLRLLGISEKKSLKYDNLPRIKSSLMKHFVRGYFDGDGSILSYKFNSHFKDKTYNYRRYVASIVATQKFCENLSLLLQKELGFKPYVRSSSSKHMSYLCYYSQNSIKAFYHYMYDDNCFSMKRKYKKWQKFLGSLNK